MEQNSRNNNTKWIVLVVLAILLSACLGALAGGAAGFWAGRKTAGRAQQDWTLPFLEATPAPTRQPRWRMATPEAPELQLPIIYGALVTDVVEDSPADAAGIEVDDIIIAIGGETITADSTPSTLIGKHRPGDSVQITVRRGDQERTLQARLGSNPSNSSAAYLGIYYRLEPRLDSPSMH